MPVRGMLLKAEEPIEDKIEPGPKVRESSCVFAKAESPMDNTVVGNVREPVMGRLEKARSPITDRIESDSKDRVEMLEL